MASLVERLVRYVNCRGSKMGGRRFFMCLRIGLLKTLHDGRCECNGAVVVEAGHR